MAVALIKCRLAKKCPQANYVSSLSLRQRYAALRPNDFFLDAERPAEILAYLQQQSVVEAQRPGFLERLRGKTAQTPACTAEALEAGNMNYVVRLQLNDAASKLPPSLILKQSRPWVERYPSIAAPAERARAEARYYKLVEGVPSLAAASPTLLHSDAANNVLVMQDLGAANDLIDLYAGAPLNRQVADGTSLLEALLTYLSTLHRHFAQHPPARPVVNKAMRTLNHEHIFALPFRSDNGLDLAAYHPSLPSAFAKTIDDEARVRAMELGRQYLNLGSGTTLLHGDFYPGSFLLNSDSELFVIDPEFCFTGPPEFDFGVLAAHLHLSGNGTALKEARGHYSGQLVDELWQGFAGAEILRRLFGVAQLPLGDVDRPKLAEVGRRLLLGRG